MKRIYVAGAYSADNLTNMLQNMKKGMRTALDVLMAGFAPYTPWFDYQFTLISKPNEIITQDRYREYGIAWLEASDGVLLVPGWEKSEGTKAEIKRAEELNIPVFHNLRDVIFMLGDGDNESP